MSLSQSEILRLLERPEDTTLKEEERVWALFQPRLEAQGYMLRPRYRPDWSLPPGTTPWDSETAIPAPGYAHVLDAIRTSDGAPVVLKIVETDSADTNISGFLTNEPGAAAFCVPIIELLELDDEWSFMVMPRMRQCDKPEFETVGEFIEFVQQVLEGLVFLHSKNIAHLDICVRNIVMDYSRMIPHGFHFASPQTSNGKHRLRRYVGPNPDPDPSWMAFLPEDKAHTADPTDPHRYYSRTEVGLMKYCYLDFGISVRFPSYEERGRVVGNFSQLREHAPELSNTVPYDPFKVDIRLVGEMLRDELVKEYHGLGFMAPFIRKLRRHSPEKRPDAVEALALFQRQVVSKLAARDLAQPITRLPLPVWATRRERLRLFVKRLGSR
ncbi:hypothetical protein DFH06DRAFT_555792 [Mycena polygramma]|nr:hypothetical protein DFH06DRAFT_555792 [Mycena polygramma]